MQRYMSLKHWEHFQQGYWMLKWFCCLASVTGVLLICIVLTHNDICEAGFYHEAEKRRKDEI